jgi:5-formyltetrahydrofolate cyclo-ligase
LTTLPSLVERKAALRLEMMARRAEMSARSGGFAASAVAERIMQDVSMPAGAVVSAYWPLEGELDPRPAMRRLAERGHVLALPRMQGRLQPLRFHRWGIDDALVEGRFRVMEPAEGEPVLQPDVMLVPLLAFDRAGRRLGYGAGFYDRTLAALRAEEPRLLALGVAFAGQEVSEVPDGPQDEVLDAVITEEAVHWFGARPNLAPRSGPS